MANRKSSASLKLTEAGMLEETDNIESRVSITETGPLGLARGENLLDTGSLQQRQSLFSVCHAVSFVHAL